MRNRSLPTSNDVWGCWNLKRAADGEIMIDFFVTNGSPRDPWVALVPFKCHLKFRPRPWFTQIGRSAFT